MLFRSPVKSRALYDYIDQGRKVTWGDVSSFMGEANPSYQLGLLENDYGVIKKMNEFYVPFWYSHPGDWDNEKLPDLSTEVKPI